MSLFKTRFPFFIFLFPIFFVLHGFTENYYFVSMKSALLLTAIYLLASLVLTSLFYLISRKLPVAALMASLLLFIEFFFGFIHDFIRQVAGHSFFSKYSFVLAFLSILILFFYLIIKKRQLNRVSGYLNILFLVLILVDLANLIIKARASSKKIVLNLPAGSIKCDSCSRPDIYIITLDGYAGNDQLRKIFSYDNSRFLEQLDTRGFRTIPVSESNYDSSPSSMASTLDMEYLSLHEKNNMRKKGHQFAFRRINNNKLMNFLKAHGYEPVNYSIFKVMGQAAPIGGAFVPANARLINDNTLTSRLKKEVFINIATKLNLKGYLKKSLYAANRDNEKLYNLTIAKAKERSDSPKVVYTHLMMPHHPYYYDEGGVFKSYEELSKIPLSDTGAYLSYLKFTNKKVLSLADSILSYSGKPPVIVIISDHGFRYFNSNYEEFAFSNLLAIHLPDKDYNKFPDTMTNVNLFRTILNTTFHQRLPMLKDSSFVVEF